MILSRSSKSFEGPCSNCEFKSDCVPYGELSSHLFSHKKFQEEPTHSDIDEKLDEIVIAFISSARELVKDGRLSSDKFGYALSSLVDFCISGVYANNLIDTRGAFKQNGLKCGESRIVFPYTWMCPLCVEAGLPASDCYLPDARRESQKGVVRDYPRIELLAKPGGRAIGDQGIQVIKSLLRAMLKLSPTKVRLRDGGGARGEFDLTIATDELIAFVEVKAKPLICYPVVVGLDKNGSQVGTSHRWVETNQDAIGRVRQRGVIWSVALGHRQAALAVMCRG